MYTFADKLEQGLRGEAFLDAVFADDFTITKATREQDRRGIDRIYTDKTGKIYTIQYKADRKAAETHNAFIELISNDVTGKKGWAYTCKAEHVMYFVDDTGPIYIVRTSVIRDHLKEWNGQFTLKVIANKNQITQEHIYNSIGTLVPLDVLEEVSYRVVNI